jgi:outer membrane protein assembly factor BamD
VRTTGTRRILKTAVWTGLVALAACGPKRAPLTELTAEDLWGRGIEAYNGEDWDGAIRYFDRFALVGGTDPRTYQARYYSAQAHFEKDEYVTAAAEFARLATDLGRHDQADDARFGACRAYEELSPDPQLDQEYTRAALDHCGALVEYFPDSEFAGPAGEIVDQMWDKLAEKVYSSGDWYRRRRAYDSALLYFEDVVEQYPQTRWAPRALLRMVEIYGILEWDEEREETRSRLLREYPQSEAAKDVQGNAAS